MLYYIFCAVEQARHRGIEIQNWLIQKHFYYSTVAQW